MTPGSAEDQARAALEHLRQSAFADGHPARESAERTLARLRAAFYDPMLGMLHAQQPLAYGFLADNAWTMLAFTEAYLMSGRKPYRDFADELARFLFQELWEREHGGFMPCIPPKGGQAPRPALHAPDNAVAFEAVWRLAEIKGTANYRKWVQLGLRSPLLAGDGEPFARVREMLSRGRMDLELVGRLDDLRTRALLTAVNRLDLPRKIVSFVDPDDQDYILAHKLEASSYPRLFACGPDLHPMASTDEPGEVAAVVEALRR